MEDYYDMIDDMSFYDLPFYMRGDIIKFIQCFGLTPDDLVGDDYL